MQSFFATHGDIQFRGCYWEKERAPFIETAIQAHADSLLLTLLPKIIMKLSSDETYIWFNHSRKNSPQSFFEKVVEQFFRTEEFLHKNEARVVLSLLFRIGMFEVGAIRVL